MNHQPTSAALKRCRSCERDLEVWAFAKDKSRKDGRQNACRECKKDEERDRYKAKKRETMKRKMQGVLFDLDAAGLHRLAFDERQFIVQRKTANGWKGISFIAQKSVTLLRVIEEKGIEMTPEARREIEDLPETFRAWITQHGKAPVGR